jgi:3-isopropylmalate/(R)-2-methylmalate dehydratase small subunit
MHPMRGRVAWKFADDFDIDLIVGVKNIAERDIQKLSRIAMAGFFPNFAESVNAGDFLVAGHNFGYGHPHMQGMAVMKHLGIKVIIAESFGYSFFRGEYALGLILLPCKGISTLADRGDELIVDIQEGAITNCSSGKSIRSNRIPKPAMEIIIAGGLIPYLKARIANAKNEKFIDKE